jgi:large subunit ribosomal protein L29
MTSINASELRNKNINELKDMLFSSRDEQFKLRMQASSSEQKVKSHTIKEVRRNIARIKMVLNEKTLGVKHSESVESNKVDG